MRVDFGKAVSEELEEAEPLKGMWLQHKECVDGVHGRELGAHRLFCR